MKLYSILKTVLNYGKDVRNNCGLHQDAISRINVVVATHQLSAREAADLIEVAGELSAKGVPVKSMIKRLKAMPVFDESIDEGPCAESFRVAIGRTIDEYRMNAEHHAEEQILAIISELEKANSQTYYEIRILRDSQSDELLSTILSK